VQADPGGVEARAQRDGQLAKRAHIQVEALLEDPAGDGPAEEALARVIDLPPGERLSPGKRPPPEVDLVDHVHRRSCLREDVAHRQTAHVHLPAGATDRGATPQAVDEGVGVRRPVQPHRGGGTDVGMDRSGNVHMGHDAQLCHVHPGRHDPRQVADTAAFAWRGSDTATMVLESSTALVAMRCPHSSGDRAPPSGGGSAGSNPAGGAPFRRVLVGPPTRMPHLLSPGRLSSVSRFVPAAIPG
jgi:hypothetical protein